MNACLNFLELKLHGYNSIHVTCLDANFKIPSVLVPPQWSHLIVNRNELPLNITLNEYSLATKGECSIFEGLELAILINPEVKYPNIKITRKTYPLLQTNQVEFLELLKRNIEANTNVSFVDPKYLRMIYKMKNIVDVAKVFMKTKNKALVTSSKYVKRTPELKAEVIKCMFEGTTPPERSLILECLIQDHDLIDEVKVDHKNI